MKYRYISRRGQIIKSFYTGIGKTFVIYPSAFFMAVALGILNLGMVFYLYDVFHATSSQIGNLYALWSAFYIIGCLFLRVLLDSILPRYLLIISSFVMSSFIVMILCAKSIIYIYVFYGMIGLFDSLFWPPLMGWLSYKKEGTELSKLISRYNFSWSLGTIISPFIAGKLSSMDARLPIYVSASTFFVIGILIAGAAMALPGIRSDRYSGLQAKSEEGLVDKSTVLRYQAWIGIFMSYMVLGIIKNIFPVYARGELIITKHIIGILFLGRALFSTFGFMLMGKTTFWHFKLQYMILVQIGIVVFLVLMNFSTSIIIFMILFVLFGFLVSMSYTSSVFHGVSGSINRSTRMAIHEATLSGGLIIGSSIGGMIYQNYNMSYTYIFCIGVIVFGIIIQMIIFLVLKNRKLVYSDSFN